MRKLGQGSFGEAYLGAHDQEGYEVVVKIFTSKQAYPKMLREIMVLQTVCGGPNIMKLYDVVRENVEGHPALVLEYVESSYADTDEVYQSLTPQEVKFYMRQLLEALAYTHKMEIIHRDVKPHNALIDKKKKVLMLIDFGLSVFHEQGENNEQLISANFYYFQPHFLIHAMHPSLHPLLPSLILHTPDYSIHPSHTFPSLALTSCTLSNLYHPPIIFHRC